MIKKLTILFNDSKIEINYFEIINCNFETTSVSLNDADNDSLMNSLLSFELFVLNNCKNINKLNYINSMVKSHKCLKQIIVEYFDGYKFVINNSKSNGIYTIQRTKEKDLALTFITECSGDRFIIPSDFNHKYHHNRLNKLRKKEEKKSNMFLSKKEVNSIKKLVLKEIDTIEFMLKIDFDDFEDELYKEEYENELNFLKVIRKKLQI